MSFDPAVIPSMLRRIGAYLEWVADYLEKHAMGREAKVIAAQKAEIDALKAQIAAAPPPPDPKTIKDAADLAAEDAAATALGLDANGDPAVTPPPPPAVGA